MIRWSQIIFFDKSKHLHNKWQGPALGAAPKYEMVTMWPKWVPIKFLEVISLDSKYKLSSCSKGWYIIYISYISYDIIIWYDIRKFYHMISYNIDIIWYYHMIWYQKILGQQTENKQTENSITEATLIPVDCRGERAKNKSESKRWISNVEVSR